MMLILSVNNAAAPAVQHNLFTNDTIFSDLIDRLEFPVFLAPVYRQNFLALSTPQITRYTFC
jgi:hypothetical protein